MCAIQEFWYWLKANQIDGTDVVIGNIGEEAEFISFNHESIGLDLSRKFMISNN